MEKVVLAAMMTWLLFCFFPLVFIPYTIICFACMHRGEPDGDEERKKERERERELQCTTRSVNTTNMLVRTVLLNCLCFESCSVC